jgi:hypothetical protein
MRRAVTLALLCVVPAMAGCGSSTPTKAQYLAKADPICRQANAVAAVFTTPSDVPSIKDFANKVADNTAKTAGQLDKLKLPGGKDGDAAKAMVKAMKDAAAAARTLPGPVDSGNYPVIEDDTSKTADAYKAADDKARSLGSTECGKGDDEAVAKLAQTVGPTVKAAFIAKADVLCAAVNAEMDKVPEPQNFEDVKALIDKAVDAGTRLTAQINALPQPHFDHEKLAEALAANEAILAKAKEAQASAHAGDQKKTVVLAEELDQLGTASDVKADAYGFKDCGSQGK